VNHFQRYAAVFVLAFACCCGRINAQQYADQRSSQASAARRADPSQLGKENADRVAASALQIREILVKEPGLVVELKGWIAKEATDSGQIIDDESLTDQAIFDRLEEDVKFRAVATRLLQHYGYLLPSVNPDSEYGKQQELVLKERARRLVQIEAQEDAESLKQRNEEGADGVERTKDCDSRASQNCDQIPEGKPKRNVYENGELPGGKQDRDWNPAPLMPPASSSPILRAGMNGDLDASSLSGVNTNDMVRLAALARSRDPLSIPSSSDGAEIRGDSLGSDSATNSASKPRSGSSRSSSRESERSPGDSSRSSATRNSRAENDRGAPEGAVVHKANPYADIPSLYDLYVQVPGRDRAPERFGVEILSNGIRESDAIPMDLPVGPDYVVGPGDGLAINLWGGVSQRMIRTVDREGRITLPEVGPLLVSGRTIGDVQLTVQQVLRTQYRDISADVSLSQLHMVRVYVVGEIANPGAYDVSSLSTPLNALVAAGGVTEHGSLRSLKHFRGKRLVEEVDAYDLLLRGVSASLQRLESGDSLLVPPAGPQVTVEGTVRRPAIYELHGEQSLEDALELAGGVLPSAALEHVEVERLVAHEKRTMFSLDLSSKTDTGSAAMRLSNFHIQDGDRVHIFPIAPYNEEAIYLQGHVLRPGRYSYREGMKLSDLVSSYGDLLPEPAGIYAEIIRLNPPDFRPSVEGFDLAAALANPAKAPNLKPLDTVRVFSRYDFEPVPEVLIGGEVRSPGTYRISGRAHLRDAIYLAGGPLPDADLVSAQLFRTEKDGAMQILSLNLNLALAGNPADNLLLQPRDRVIVHRTLTSVNPPTVYVKGEVPKPGRYPLTTNMHVEDLVQVAGGLKRSAYTESADLMRYPETDQQQISSEFVTVNLGEALSGEVKANLALHDGDVLTIKPIAGWSDIGASVTLRGEVQHPGTYGIRSGERLSTALGRAGGFTSEAYPYGAVLMRREVRDLEIKAHNEMIARVKAERVQLKVLPEANADEKNAKLTALARTDATLNQLVASEPIGRVVIHVQPGTKEWKDTAADVTLRDGDVLVVPKKENYVMVNGQVFNPTAISYRSGLSAKWYLSQAGGLTPLADKKAVFVIRADGSVISAKNNGSGWWMGDPMNTTLRAGDTVVVPEKAIKVGGPNWAQIMQAAQLASSVALAVAYIHP